MTEIVIIGWTEALAGCARAGQCTALLCSLTCFSQVLLLMLHPHNFGFFYCSILTAALIMWSVSRADKRVV